MKIKGFQYPPREYPLGIPLDYNISLTMMNITHTSLKWKNAISYIFHPSCIKFASRGLTFIFSILYFGVIKPPFTMLSRNMTQTLHTFLYKSNVEVTPLIHKKVTFPLSEGGTSVGVSSSMIYVLSCCCCSLLT